MTKPATVSPDLQAPTGEVPPPPSEGKKPRGARKRVLGEGEGDYLIYECIGEGQKFPKGTLLPIPGVPQFEDTQKAIKWLKNESGDLLSGKQVMILRACEILSLIVQQQPTVVISSKPKIAVAKAAETSSNG